MVTKKANSFSRYPVLKRYDQNHLLRLAMPVGGIGTGSISLGGRGNLQDWEIFNQPAKKFSPKNAFFALFTSDSEGKKSTRALEGRIHPTEYEGSHGAAVPNHGLPRFKECTFDAAYPLASVLLSDPEVPLHICMEVFNPFLPTKADASGIPVMVIRYNLVNPTSQPVQAAVCGNFENFIGRPIQAPPPSLAQLPGDERAPNMIEFRKDSGLQGLFYSAPAVDRRDPLWGTMSLATLHQEGVSYRTSWARLNWGDALLDYWDDFSSDGVVEERAQAGQAYPTGSLAVKTVVLPNSSAAFTFLITWHFPNRQTWTPSKPGEDCSCVDPASCDHNTIGNYYTWQYSDAWDVANSVALRLEELESRTVEFVRAVVDSDLPVVVKEAALFNTSTLRSPTVFRTPDGTLFGWEGCHDHRGCCHGSCTHVWNYEQATPFLFGELSRSMRRVEFARCTDERGLMSFRVGLPETRSKHWNLAAADGQMGCIMKLFRDWQLSGDDGLLQELWEPAKRALAFCWIPGGWDGDQDGVMEGCQHNTMDVEYYGPNPQMQGWYLGALNAAQLMAVYLGDMEFAQHCADLFMRGSKWMDEHLFNGEYYEHQIRPPLDESAIAPGLRHESMGARDLSDPELQLGAGCLIDQLVGQYMAHVCGLGYLHKKNNVRTTLQSLMKYNYRTDFSGHFNHLRSFVLNDESGMVMASYPHDQRPKRPFPYYNEVMTGFEYTAAVHMLYENQISAGIKLIRSIRSRYDGYKRSPFDEAECGHHYARAMASWGALLALTGFQYSGVSGVLHFKGRKKPVSWFWSTGDAWGTFSQTPDTNSTQAVLEVKGGEIKIRRLHLAGIGFIVFPTTQVIQEGKSLVAVINW